MLPLLLLAHLLATPRTQPIEHLPNLTSPEQTRVQVDHQVVEAGAVRKHRQRCLKVEQLGDHQHLYIGRPTVYLMTRPRVLELDESRPRQGHVQ